MVMSALELREIVLRLPVRAPVTDEYEARLDARRAQPRLHSSQRAHLDGWLAQFNGPGAFKRKTFDRNARHFYQNFRCAPGLLWLAEALGEDETVLRRAVAEIDGAGANPGSQCAAFRRVVAWERIEELIEAHERARAHGPFRRIADRFARSAPAPR